MRALMLLVLLLACTPSPPSTGGPPDEAEAPRGPAVVGDPFPAFDLPSPDGTRRTEAALRGRWTVVELIRSGDW